eukprot:TRINITY_DN1610_c0_g1::TRINITY_DN1610_c0_g1_i1::g.17836::m.17836 TRINITY_DN1610_c0_g1::TRINITY_DN1610_c0_g1_i1::g.17836  ORF type:complete len:491 (-),score=125.05,sp/P9WLL5/Y2075_MYCTU/24.12/5e-16,PI-PLC-X/PF00388.14/0.033 TRINITY_DN1610_c0_g1_i1:342-1814(-)
MALYPLAALVAALIQSATAFPLSGNEHVLQQQISVQSDSHHAPTPWYWGPMDCTLQTLCNGEMCDNVCVPGTLVVDPWLKAALASQRELQRKEPLIYNTIPATHNSAVSRAYGMGIEAPFLSNFLAEQYPDSHEVNIANQRLSVTDQLNLGVRQLEIDIWKLPKLDTAHICHWPVCPPDFYLFVSYASVKQRDRLDWECSRLGCDEDDKPTYETIMTEIQTWLNKPENLHEFIIIYIDNRAEQALQDVVDVNNKLFGSTTLLPEHIANEFGGQFPSIDTLVSRGFRIVFETNGERWWDDELGKKYIFKPDWLQFDPYDMRPFPECQVSGVKFYGEKFSRSLDGSLVLGPAKPWDGRNDYFLEDIRYLSDCGVNMQALDQMTPVMMKEFVWTWAESQLPTPGRCVAMAKTTGRWFPRICDEVDNSYHAACQSDADKTHWVLSLERHTFDNIHCPAGFHFAHPTDSYLNALLRRVATMAPMEDVYIWINLRH